MIKIGFELFPAGVTRIRVKQEFFCFISLWVFLILVFVFNHCSLLGYGEDTVYNKNPHIRVFSVKSPLQSLPCPTCQKDESFTETWALSTSTLSFVKNFRAGAELTKLTWSSQS